MKKILLIILSFLFFFSLQKTVLARDYLVDYQVEYEPFKKESQILTKVNFKIKITHLRSDVYVNKFKLIFPENFKISQIEGKNNREKINININKINFNNEITVSLSNPNVGKNSINNIYLSFYQEEIFKENGNIIEGFIPTIQDPETNSYQVIVFLPETFGKKISLSKPKPSLIKQKHNQSVIYWQDPKEKSLYVVFGKEQYYKVKLIYQLKNDQLFPVYQSVAFLPETSYQKVFINKISPSPVSVYLDDDGNLIGKYLIAPKNSFTAVLEGNILVSNNNNLEKIKYDRRKIQKQREYLLSETKYWKIKNMPNNDLSSPQLIYRFIVDKLSYNFEKVGKITKRAHPDEILINASDAICLDYTDLFVTLAREKGIASRAIVGYGYSQEQRLRPLSLQGDILHSWPEYFDEKQLFWKPVDPTWEDTSGIDFFSSLDYNHIAFAILGKDPDKPVPAGMYQWDNQQKIFIKPINEKPIEKISLKIEKLDWPKKIFSFKEYHLSFNIRNAGNVYLYDVPIEINSDKLDYYLTQDKIDILPPLASYQLSVKLKVKNRYNNVLGWVNGVSHLRIGRYFQSKNEFIIIPFYFQVAVIFIFLSSISGVIFLLIRTKKKKRKDIHY